MAEPTPDPAAAGPPPPVEPVPDPSHPHHELWLRVREAIGAVPPYFDSATSIEGVQAGDLFSLNSVLGSTIEVEVVKALNRIRDTWDPPLPGSTVGRYAHYAFERHPQSYPDVRLQTADGSEVLLGLELKGWYLLAKEREPSYRFKATPLAAGERDLLVVVPWYLHNVLSGSPVVLEPFVKPARWAAEYRNWHWQWERGNPKRRPQATRGVRLAAGVTPPPPYPPGKTEMSDRPIEDGGANFGRLSRAGVMDDYIARLLETDISEIAARNWIAFFTIFTESSSPEQIAQELRRMEAEEAARRDRNPLAVRTLSLVRELLAAVDAAQLDDLDDERGREDALRGALAGRRRDLEDLIRAAHVGGVPVKAIARLAGLTPRAVEQLIEPD